MTIEEVAKKAISIGFSISKSSTDNDVCYLSKQGEEPFMELDKNDCENVVDILQSFHDGELVEVFYESPNGYQRVYELDDLLDGLKQKRAVRVLELNLLSVKIRH